MDWIVVEGLKPWDGRYPLESLDFTTREWGWIKRLAGYLPATVEDGFRGGDPELISVFALIAMHRAGKLAPAGVPGLYERMQDAPLGATLRLESDTADQEQGDVGPPTLSSSESSSGSGTGSTTSSETSPDHRNGSGSHDSATSVYDPATWQT